MVDLVAMIVVSVGTIMVGFVCMIISYEFGTALFSDDALNNIISVLVIVV